MGEAHRAVGTSKGRGSARARRGHLSGSLRRKRDARVASPLTRHGSTRSGNAPVAPVTQIAVAHQPSPPCGDIPATPVFAWAGRAPRGVGGLPGQSALSCVKPGPSVRAGPPRGQICGPGLLRPVSAPYRRESPPGPLRPSVIPGAGPSSDPRIHETSALRVHGCIGCRMEPCSPATPRPRKCSPAMQPGRASHGT